VTRSISHDVLQGSSTAEESEEGKEISETGPEPLTQLLTAFSRAATTELAAVLEADFLYISYANIMGQVSKSLGILHLYRFGR
jgi:hypothetical protein